MEQNDVGTTSPMNTADDDGFDDFAAFAEAAPPSRQEEAGAAWDAFSDAPHPSSSSADDWASFSQSTQPPAPLEPVVGEKINLPSLTNLVDDDGTLSSVADDKDTNFDTDNIDALTQSMYAQDENAKQSNENGEVDFCELWHMYATIDDTPALKYAWTRAHLRQLLLKMLEMDETLAQLRQSNLPAFAAHLSLAAPLQPRQASALDPTVLVPSSSLGINARTQMSPNELQPHLDSLAVEPVSFDWRDSGLSNPLSAGRTSANLDSNALSLDLDFLEKAGNKSTPPLKPEPSTKATQKHASKSTTQSPVLPVRSLTETPLALQQDLAQSALIQEVMRARAEQRALAARAGVPVVNKNGAKKPSLNAYVTPTQRAAPGSTTSTTTSKTGDQQGRQTPILQPHELSADAKRLHDNLPNMDFMLSNMLMFPVKSTDNDKK